MMSQMRKKSTICIAMILALSLSITPVTNADGPHWVNDELAELKQMVLYNVQTVSDKQWISVKENVFNATQLDDPISIGDWSSLLRMMIPQKQENEVYVDLYSMSFGEEDQIARENAVGGMVKLLNMSGLNTDYQPGEVEQARDAFKDYDKISDKQQSLLAFAYRTNLLDSATTGTSFRPADRLTNAEAVSMLYKAGMKLKSEKIGTPSGPSITMKWSVSHWSTFAVQALGSSGKVTGDLQRLIESVGEGNPDDAIQVQDWHQLLYIGFALSTKGVDKATLSYYTFDMSEGDYMNRGSAVTGLMKALILAGHNYADASEEQRKHAATAFTDFNKAVDTSKLALAYDAGLVAGYANATFRPEKLLTKAEAVVLLARAMNDGTKGKS